MASLRQLTLNLSRSLARVHQPSAVVLQRNRLHALPPARTVAGLKLKSSQPNASLLVTSQSASIGCKGNNPALNFQRLLSSNAHDHSKLWVLEKAVSLGLLAVIPAAFACQSSALDYALALSLVAHVHWGLEAIVVDYIRPALFGAVIPKAALGSLYLLSILALAGLFYLNYSDVGLSTAVRMIGKV